MEGARNDSLVERYALVGVAAAAEALFPANDYGAPDFRDTDLEARMRVYWAELPARQRRLLVSLFVVVELGALILPHCFRRFSRLSVAERERAVRSWRGSRLSPLRLLGDALKATLTVLYMSHPKALAYIGVPEGPACGAVAARAEEP